MNLPVPQDEEFREAAQALGYLQRSGQRAEGQVTGQEWADRFRTPRSWASEEKGKGMKGLAAARTQGPLPTMQSQGAAPATPRELPGKGGIQDDKEKTPEQLEREMERLMLEQALEQNEKLQEEIQRLKRDQVKGNTEVARRGVSRSRDRERTPPRPPQGPPPPSPPQRRKVYTPQGTAVPSPAREDEMMYEMPPFPSWSGASFESAETYYVNQKVQTPREARVQWLEREVESLRTLLHEERAAERTSGYWGMPMQREHESRPRTLEEMQREEEAGRRAKAMLTEENTEDALRSFPITLPKLASPSEKNAALLAGDWLTQIKPLISDVSTKAAGWWELVLRKTMEKYSLWLEAGPLERLRILPPEDDDFPKGYGGRLVQRVTTMLLAAVPEELRGELISTRQLTPQGILFRVLKAFQPGSLYERSQTLAALTGTAQAADPQEAVDALRLWRRQLLRAAELGASLPDPILLVNALDRVMGLLLQQQAQAAFSVSSYRMQHGIDVRPSKEAVQQFQCEWRSMQMVGIGGRMPHGAELQVPSSGPGGQGEQVLDVQCQRTQKGRVPLQGRPRTVARSDWGE